MTRGPRRALAPATVREPRSRVLRALLYAALVALAAAAVGGAYETFAEARDARAHPFPGRLIEVDGRRLHLDCRGDEGPAVVLISGFGEISSDWAWISEDLRRTTRVCAYDPAGRAWSDPPETPQDGLARARDLHDLLRAAGETGPYVLVGHSFGGLYARIFAAEYPEQVAGMVLLDATHPDMFDLPSYPRFYEVYRRASVVLPSLARLGAGRLVYASARAGLPSPAREEARALSSTPRSFRDQRDEWAEAPTAMAQARVLTTLGDRPLVVVTAARGAQPGWLPLQRQLSGLSANVQLRIFSSADHSGLLEDRDQAERSTAAIREVVAAARHDTPLGSR